jgi:hypothetical protein
MGDLWKQTPRVAGDADDCIIGSLHTTFLTCHDAALPPPPDSHLSGVTKPLSPRPGMVPCQGPDSVWLHASDSHQNRVVRPESNLMEWHLEEVNELQDAHNEEELPTSTLPQHKLFGPGPHTRKSREDSDEGDDAVILEELTRKRPKKRTGSAMPLDIFNLDVEYVQSCPFARSRPRPTLTSHARAGTSRPNDQLAGSATTRRASGRSESTGFSSSASKTERYVGRERACELRGPRAPHEASSGGRVRRV